MNIEDHVPPSMSFGRIQHVDETHYWIKTTDDVAKQVSKELNSESGVSLVAGDHVKLFYREEMQLVSGSKAVSLPRSL